MAEEFEFSLPQRQVDALIAALERLGVNSGKSADLLEYFRNPETISAARGAYKTLRRTVQDQSRKRGGSEPVRELQKEPPIVAVRRAHRALKDDYMDILSQVVSLLAATREASGLLNQVLTPQLTREVHAAAEKLTEALSRIRYSETDLAAKLRALDDPEP